ncbi:nitroreductase family protein [Gloeocapsa sp. PCC 73106]|uniref:nitroreductase family protein n=1 Tax=Gloeocapsa sp. PCC 73106 TaxID=102232 RepID=UPI0002ACFD3D|nr:nitroreductase family protein [Gloeocapsa sp. PCC 73106]ELR98766.1 nitroreductase [Gloeocapsa sp. PCC 73106]
MIHLIDEVIRHRRSCKTFDGSPVSHETINELLELAILAPMHRRTNPWRFRVLDKSALERLCAWWSDPTELRAGAEDPDQAQLKAKIFQNQLVPKLGAVIVVTTQRDVNPMINVENRDAVAAAVQNILLAAEGRGLGVGVFWSTGPHWRSTATQDWLGIDREREALVAALSIGGKTGHFKIPPRLPLTEVTAWL